MHTCFAITNEDHAVQQNSLLKSFRLKLFSYQIQRLLERKKTRSVIVLHSRRVYWFVRPSLIVKAPVHRQCRGYSKE